MDISDETDPYVINNNPPDEHWVDEYERRYKTTKSSIEYDMRIYVDIPFDADDKLRVLVRKLNNLRPLNQFDRTSAKQKEEIEQLQEECVFLWLKYMINKCIERRTSIPPFLQNEELFEKYFATICNQYVRCKVNEDYKIFKKFQQKISKMKKNRFYDKEMCITIVNGYIGHSESFLIPSVVNDMCLLYYAYINIMYVFCDKNGDANEKTSGNMTLFHSNNLNDFTKLMTKNVINELSIEMPNIRLWMKNDAKKMEYELEWMLVDEGNCEMHLLKLLSKKNIGLCSNMCIMIDIKENNNKWNKSVDSNYYPDFAYPNQLKLLLDMGFELDMCRRALLRHDGNMERVLNEIIR